MPNEADNHINSSYNSEKVLIVNVAVAVIHHKAQYLLGFRNAAQHQGNRYEFVGGKIETNENAEQALIREVAEETGIEICDNTMVKLGRLHHDYGDKQVSLQIYKVELTAQQYEQHKHRQYGLEGQALTWVNKADLLAGKYHLPAANQTILEWLSVSTTIAITYPLTHFDATPDPVAAWLTFHQNKLIANAWVYIRIKAAGSASMAAQLMHMRPDIKAIVPCDVNGQTLTTEAPLAMKDTPTANSIVANQLSHTELLQWSEDTQDRVLSKNYPLIVSCHDAASIDAANKLAHARLQQQLSPVIGAFLSPVLVTHTHPDTVPLGWESWSALAQLADMPIIGLGGLSPVMIDQVLEHGGISVAGIRQFFE